MTEWRGKYLIRDRGRQARAHYWIGNDTVCRMYSTGGMRRQGCSVHDTDCGREICQMCRHLMEKDFK